MIPEPSTFILGVLGMIALLVVAKKGVRNAPYKTPLSFEDHDVVSDRSEKGLTVLTPILPRTQPEPGNRLSILFMVSTCQRSLRRT